MEKTFSIVGVFLLLAFSSFGETESESNQSVTSTTASGLNVDIDGNEQFDALTDGLLVLRSMFGLTAKDFAEQELFIKINTMIPLSQSALSQHLTSLRRAGLVQTRREAQTIYYSLCGDEATQVITVLQSIYCPELEV